MMLLVTLTSVAQASDSATDKAKDILTEITTFKVVEALTVVITAYLLIQLSSRLLFWLSERVAKESRLRIKQFVPFVRMLVLIIALVVLMNQLFNLSRENVFAITGTVAVAVGFAFKDYVNSIIAGVLGLFEAPYQIGDRIQIEDDYGEVITYGLRGLRLKTPTDDIVSIPHNKIWTHAISNSNMGNLEAQVVTHFYLEHSVDAQQVQDILYRVAQTSRYTELRLPIVVIVEDKIWGTLFSLKCYPIDARHEFKYKTDLTIRAKQTFRDYDISYPQIPRRFLEDIQS
ncbi:mechanosensitive ion channel [Leptolyngbya cf. ectocarpi LEGE 11479]|uniref:Mechanosensitive ion channel n=1 Tax=Leptolyngbya cf. ectocarpi LEGE 11479 TaxID=1828722 RepID=A0A928ZVX2_LEPEC|nr:mechanosensitive ion channel domain-containing protein [Leptolyngbya ectocarpi]MBE9068355.1 mechanosensitive ion channel [Leptolyngbya cf. ectocarpi LEGE 11479]